MRSIMNSFDKTSERVSVFRYGFTLVELLVVIAIIGILMGIAVPAIFGVIETANSNKQKLELGAIEQAIERYQQQYGDYPPDFSNWTVVERHYRKIFPRIAPAELNLLQRLLDVDPSNDISASPTTAAHDPARMDRAEAIVWTLGGYSSNPITPFTGPGGPLSLVEGGTDATYQVNVDRDNEFFDFDTTRLDLVIEDTDNYYKSSDSVAGNPDLFPHYQASDKTPFVYFDSRTYFHIDPTAGFNGYVNKSYTEDEDALRPYMSDRINDEGEPIPMNADTFQLIAPGIDSQFGWATHVGGSYSNNPQTDALYFRYPKGDAYVVVFRRGRLRWGPVDLVARFQEPRTLDRIDNPHQDNLTNFADGKLIDELEE